MNYDSRQVFVPAPEIESSSNTGKRFERARRALKAGFAIVAVGAAATTVALRIGDTADNPAAEHFTPEATGTYVVQPGDTAANLGTYARDQLGDPGSDDYRDFQNQITDQLTDGKMVAGVTEIRMPNELDVNPDQDGIQMPVAYNRDQMPKNQG